MLVAQPLRAAARRGVAGLKACATRARARCRRRYRRSWSSDKERSDIAAPQHVVERREILADDGAKIALRRRHLTAQLPVDLELLIGQVSSAESDLGAVISKDLATFNDMQIGRAHV